MKPKAVGDAVFLAICVALVALAIARGIGGVDHVVAPISGAREDIVKRGTTLESIPGVPFDRREVTIALVLHSDCQFCVDSIPFYQRLSELRSPEGVGVVALTHEPIDSFKPFAAQRQLSLDAVAGLAGGEVPSAGTPTLLLVDRGSHVRASWLGRLNRAQESRVIELVRRLSTARTPS